MFLDHVQQQQLHPRPGPLVGQLWPSKVHTDVYRKQYCGAVSAPSSPGFESGIPLALGIFSIRPHWGGGGGRGTS